VIFAKTSILAITVHKDIHNGPALQLDALKISQIAKIFAKSTEMFFAPHAVTVIILQ
jgi:hypothetical protein